MRKQKHNYKAKHRLETTERKTDSKRESASRFTESKSSLTGSRTLNVGSYRSFRPQAYTVAPLQRWLFRQVYEGLASQQQKRCLRSTTGLSLSVDKDWTDRVNRALSIQPLSVQAESIYTIYNIHKISQVILMLQVGLPRKPLRSPGLRLLPPLGVGALTSRAEAVSYYMHQSYSATTIQRHGPHGP